MAANRGVAYIKQGVVEVQSIDFPKMVDATNGKQIDHGVILKVISTNICGSDQHMVRGRTTAPSGLILGVPEVDSAIDCVGFEAHGHGKDAGKEQPATVLNSLMEITRAAGRLGIPGLYVTEDPGATDKNAKTGTLGIRIGLGWAKSHSFATGQTPTMKYNRRLMMAILHDKTQIAKAVNVTFIQLDQAPQGYKDFDKGAAKKFVIDPHGMVTA